MPGNWQFAKDEPLLIDVLGKDIATNRNTEQKKVQSKHCDNGLFVAHSKRWGKQEGWILFAPAINWPFQYSVFTSEPKPPKH